MRVTAKTVAGNTVWLLLERISARLLSYLLIIYLARQLGNLHFGSLVFAISLVHLFLILSDFGLTTLIIREVARDKANGPQYVGRAATLKIVLSVITFAVVFLVLNSMAFPYNTRLIVYLIAAYALFENMGTFFGGVFQAYERMHYNTIIQIIQKLVLFLLCFILLSSGHGLVAVCIAYLFSGILYCCVNMWFVTYRFLMPRYEVRLGFWRQLLKESLPLAVTAALSMVYYNTDQIMLGKMKGEAVVGWYGVSYQLYFMIATFSGAFLAAAFPVMSRLFGVSKDRLSIVYSKSFKALCGLGMPLSIGCFLLSREIILFLYGSQYLHSIIIFKIFAPIIIFTCLNGLAGYFLVSINRQRMVAGALAITAVVNVVLNFILIPTYSYSGAASATLVSEILFFIISFVSIPREFRRLPYISILKSLLASIIMGGGIILLDLKGLPLPVLIAAGIIIYFISMLLSGYLDNDDRKVLRDVFRIEVRCNEELQGLLRSIENQKADTIFKAIAKKLEEAGLTLMDSTAFIKDQLPPKGTLTLREPSFDEWEDVYFGFDLAKEIAFLDIGQSVAIKNRAVVAVEALEGTDNLIRRAGKISRGGFTLVKVSKPKQDMRFDIPVVGLQTIKNLIKTKASCLAIEAHKTLFIDKEASIKLANTKGMAIIAV